MPLVNAAISALLNVVILAGLPFGIYLVYHKWRYQRRFTEVARRAGLQLGAARYIGYG